VFIPFELEGKGKLSNLNLRVERHGQENVAAGDLSVTLVVPNTTLATLASTLRHHLFVKDLSGQTDIDQDHVTALRYPEFGTLAWGKDYPNVDVTILYGVDSPIFLEDCTVTKIKLTPHEGGSVSWALSIQGHPSDVDVVKLRHLVQCDIDLTALQRDMPAPQAQTSLAEQA